MNEDSIVAAALAKTNTAERAAYLDQACAGDAALRKRVEQRLAAQPQETQAPTMGVGAEAYTSSDRSTESSTSARLQEGAGSLIGPYKLVQPIGAGGMGMVYLAEQMHPVRRQVALKIIKQGMDTEQVIVRFEAERQALALMDHPNIAKVLDAGTTDSGRPYFVMELVKGVPITKYCDSNRLTVRERLELFVPVCQAIQHAHQKGIIHRDIKPSNVLVASYDDKPVPKVIDFGIAKATGVGLTDQTVFTQIGAVIGTLEYMSPEQAESTALDIDTRSDIYSLGALLYELLTGSTPMESAEFRKAAYTEVLRKIREEEPPSPSSRLSHSKETITTTSEQRKTDPGRLPKLLQGELDWIVMKSLEKDRTRRYETANGFARDIERYLSGDPVEAGPPSATYRFKKFANKNKMLIGTAAAFAALLILGVLVSTWQAIRARRAERVATTERDRADAEAATSKAVTDFLQNSLLSQASAQQQSGVNEKPDPDVKVRTLLDRAAASISGKFAGQPLVEAGVRVTIGNTYRDLNLIPQADEQFQNAYDLNLRYRGADDPETFIAIGNLGAIRADEGRYPDSLELYKKAAEGLARVLGPEDRRTVAAMSNLGLGYLRNGDFAKSEEVLKKVFEIEMKALGLDNIETLTTSDSLVSLYRSQRRWSEAEALLLKGLESTKRVYGPSHPYALREMYGLAFVYRREHKYDKAEPLLQEVLEGNTKLLGAEHPDTLATTMELANVYDGEGKYAQALSLQEKAYGTYTRVQGLDHPQTLVFEGTLAQFYEDSGQTPKAVALYKDVLSREMRVLGPKDPATLATGSNLAYIYENHKRFADALPLQIQAREAALQRYGPEDHNTIVAGTMIGKDRIMLHQYKEAEPILRDMLAVETRIKPDAWQRYNLESLLGAALLGQKKYEEAEPLLISGYEGMKQREANFPPVVKGWMMENGEHIVELYKAWGKPRKAAEWREKLKAPAPAPAPPASK
jgi:serine/threonine protein kinase